MKVRDLAGSTVLAGQVVVAALVLGVPDVGTALTFLSGGAPTGLTVTAACVLLLWVVLACVVVVHVAVIIRRLVRHLAHERVRVGALVLIGMVVLAGGVLRHSRASYAMCCGSVIEAEQAARSGP